MSRRLAVLVAHPDDAEITIGGTIALLVEAGWEVTVVNFTVPLREEEERRLRIAAAERAAGVLGHRLVWARDGELVQVEELEEFRLVELLDDLVASIGPEVVVTHWEGDGHGDHRRLAKAAISAARHARFDLYAVPPSDYRTPAFTRFDANVYVNIDEHADRKLLALGHYAYEGGPLGPEHLAVSRLHAQAAGAIAGCSSAERLLLLRQRGLAAQLVGRPEVSHR